MKTSNALMQSLKAVGLVLVGLILVACSEVESDKPSAAAESASKASQTALTVYKTPTCGCCGDWVDHINESGISSKVVQQDSLADIKTKLGIPEDARSCHTAYSDKGYVFEGHVPAKFIKQFMVAPPPGSKGLIVPAMPVGSPGMEYKNQFNPYQILLLKQDGKLELFASVNSYDEQF